MIYFWYVRILIMLSAKFSKYIFIYQLLLTRIVESLKTWIKPVQQFITTFFQSFMCPLMGLSQDASMFFSSFSIVLIAVDRFLYICEPHKKQISATMVSMNKNRSVTFIHSFIHIKAYTLSILAFVIAFILASPLCFSTKAMLSNHGSYCYEVARKI